MRSKETDQMANSVDSNQKEESDQSTLFAETCLKT